MKKKLRFMIYLILCSVVVSCSVEEITSELGKIPTDCVAALAKMIQIQLEMDDPNVSDDEKIKLNHELSKLEDWAGSNCGE